jgi:DNA-binding IclR family transcriptional regulator
MPRQSPAVQRIASILNFFVEHPQQSFNLTQVVNALKISRATCHTLLTSLADIDYLYRTPDKNYVLGPGLISLALNAQELLSPLTIARHEIRALADDLDVVVSVLTMEDGELMVRDRAASRSHIGWLIPSPRSYPFNPYGSVFYMPLTDAQLEAALEKARPVLAESDRNQIRKAVRFGREHQFVVALSPPGPQDRPNWTPSGEFLDELPDGDSQIRFIAAPILDQRGRVPLALALYGFTGTLSSSEIMRIGQHLRTVCERIQKFTFGKPAEQANA